MVHVERFDGGRAGSDLQKLDNLQFLTPSVRLWPFKNHAVFSISDNFYMLLNFFSSLFYWIMHLLLYFQKILILF